ncbi:MAG: mechanosensitive ion channel domain-containing protein, partial [Candidatus Phosphoribacter sp.]
LARPPGTVVTQIDWTVALDRLIGTPLQILAIVVAAVIGRWLLKRVIKTVVRRASERQAQRVVVLPGRAGRILADASGLAHERYVLRTQTVGALLASTVTIVIATLATLTVMATVGVPLGPLLASAGVGGVALGFGAQSLVRDFISGVFMIVEDQYGVGDTINTGEVSGVVEDVSLRVTRLRDSNGVIWYVRNGEILRLGNQSQGWSTAAVLVPLPLDTDIAAVSEILREALSGLPDRDDRVIDEATVATESLSAGAVTVRVAARCVPTASLEVQRDLLAHVKAALDGAGVALSAPAPGGLAAGGRTS